MLVGIAAVALLLDGDESDHLRVLFGD